jgi:hypothetical protein
MHRFDDDETIALEVIDATLAGEAVQPEHAELAELALILAGQRPLPSERFAAMLDERVERQFVALSPAPAREKPSPRSWWVLGSGGVAALAAATIAVIVLAGGGGATMSSSSSANEIAGASASRPALRAQRKSASPQVNNRAFGGPANSGSISSSSSGSSASSSAAAGSSAAGALAPATPASHRQVIQSAQLSLSTRPDHVEQVAQQVFNVIAAQNGVVENSNVTATNNANGYAQFQLSVPSQNLSQTMAALSRLHGAAVLSRTDATRDVTGQAGGAGRRLAEARALRTSLLRQLAAATTTTAVDSLKAQIRDVDASISSDEATLAKLHGQVNSSQISLTINASMVPGHPVSTGSSFTLGKAAHDAGRVLVVAAGIGLITLAVLLPIGLVIAVLAWIGFAIRRRRRDQALDLV